MFRQELRRANEGFAQLVWLVVELVVELEVEIVGELVEKIVRKIVGELVWRFETKFVCGFAKQKRESNAQPALGCADRTGVEGKARIEGFIMNGRATGARSKRAEAEPLPRSV
jgi:hypothetical protein